MNKQIVVVGGCNVDLNATAETKLIFQDSNPGHIKTNLGGVGRNIAENLARLGHQVKLISALGDDHFYRMVVKESDAAGLDISDCAVLQNEATSCYLCINQPDGDIAVAISDMDICSRMTPAFLESKLKVLNACDCVVVDANIPADAVDYLTEHCTALLCADTVSEKKTERLRPALKKLYFLKANRGEAEVLTGMKLDSREKLTEAAKWLHQQGVKNVAITLSEHGAFFSTHEGEAVLPPMKVLAVNSSGCGDAFFAGALTALMEHQDVRQVLRAGLAMASISATAEGAVSPTTSRTELAKVLIQYQGDE